MVNEVQVLRDLRERIQNRSSKNREHGRVEVSSKGDVEVDLSQFMEQDAVDSLPDHLEFDVPPEVSDVLALDNEDPFTLALQRVAKSTVFRLRVFN